MPCYVLHCDLTATERDPEDHRQGGTIMIKPAEGLALVPCLLAPLLWFAWAGTSRADGIAFTFTAINFPGQPYTQASDVNDSGAVVGTYIEASGGSGGNGFLYAGGSFATVDVPGGIDTSALGISSSGYIVGQYFPAGTTDTQGFLDKGGSFTTISFPGALASDASGMTGSGEMVGSYIDAGLNEQAYVEANGTFSPVNFPGATLTEALGVNAAGEIVGFYVDANGQARLSGQRGHFQ